MFCSSISPLCVSVSETWAFLHCLVCTASRLRGDVRFRFVFWRRHVGRQMLCELGIVSALPTDLSPRTFCDDQLESTYFRLAWCYLKAMDTTANAAVSSSAYRRRTCVALCGTLVGPFPTAAVGSMPESQREILGVCCVWKACRDMKKEERLIGLCSKASPMSTRGTVESRSNLIYAPKQIVLV